MGGWGGRRRWSEAGGCGRNSLMAPMKDGLCGMCQSDSGDVSWLISYQFSPGTVWMGEAGGHFGSHWRGLWGISQSRASGGHEIVPELSLYTPPHWAAGPV